MLYSLVILLLINAALAIFLAVKIARLPRTPGTRALILLTLATAWWSAGYALELSSSSLEMKVFWAELEYVAIVSIPVAWFLFCQYYTNPAHNSPFKRRFLFLWIIPGLTLILIFTNPLYSLVWSELTLTQVGGYPNLSVTYGPWFWMHVFYSYGLLLVGSILLARVLLNSIRYLRWQTSLVLLAILIPWIGNILYITGSSLLPSIDLAPFTFLIACLLFFISLTRFNLGRVAPITHKTVVERMADGILILDPQAMVLDLNLAAQNIFKLPANKAIGLPVKQLIPRISPQINLNPDQEIITKLVLGSGDDQRVYQVSVTPLLGQDESTIGSLVVLRDFSSQYLAAESDWQSSWMQDMMNFEPDAMLLVDRDAKIIHANTQAEHMFGYTREELLNKHLDLLIPERYHKQHRENVATYYASPAIRPMGAELSLFALRKAGREFPVDISLSPLISGDEIYAACVVRDISERKRVEMALRESEETYKALFEHANDAIFLLSLTGIHLQVNQKAADMLGHTRDELVGMGVSDIVVPEEYANAQNRLSSLLRGETLPIYERTFRKKDGSTIPVEINLSLIRDDAGQPSMIQSIVRGISERKKVQQEQHRLLAELQQSRDELRSLEAHLLKVVEEERRALAAELHDRVGQNLTGLNLNLNIISSQVFQYTDMAIQNRLEDSIELVEETTRLVRNVMADLHPSILDDYGLFSALHWYCDKYSQRTNIQTVLKGEEYQPRFPVSIELVLFRIVQEAMNNITKHARADRVTITLKSNPKTAILSIEDNGIGFNPAILSSANQEPHWGLLNIQERAHSVGGQLTIKSAPGQGAKISIELQREMSDD